MIKRFITVLIVSIMIITVLCSIAYAAPPENSQAISVLTLTNHEYCVDSNDVKYTKEYPNNFIQSSLNDLSKYNIIQLTSDDTDVLLKKGCLSKIMQLVDNGVIFYIQDGKLKEEELAKKLLIPYEGKSYAKGGTKLGIALMRVNNNYIFENQFYEEGNIIYSAPSNVSSNDAIPTLAPSDYAAQSNDVVPSVDPNRFKKICGSASIQKIIFNNRKGIYDDINEINQTNAEKDKLNLQNLPDGFTYYNNSNRNIVNSSSQVVGFEHITQYIFVKNTQSSGGNTYKIFDTTSRFTAGANDGYHVDSYTCRIHSNITNHEVIDHTRLNSNTSVSQSLSLSGGFSKDSVNISGGTSTSWTWTPDSQYITNYFPTTPYREWRVTSVTRDAESWLIEPGIRSVNKKAQSNKSGAFSSFRVIRIHQNNYPNEFSSSTVFEIGRWF